MTLADAEEIFEYWEQNPPTYQAAGIIARMLGWKPPLEPGDAMASEPGADSADQLLAAPPPGLAIQRGASRRPMPDIAALRALNQELAARG